MNSPIFIGNALLANIQKNVSGCEVLIANEKFYKITNSDAMRPFFMSIVSDSNHWMFISSNGGLTAGRKDCDNALFPYYTDDRITESAEITGSKTIFKVHFDDKIYLWEPFSEKYKGLYDVQTNIYKNEFGNKIIFEEVNNTFGLSFRYEWNNSNRFGFVKKSTLKNESDRKTKVELLDGLQNIMPYGVNADLQNNRSNLVDAYKKSELELNEGLGIFALSAIIVDRAEPSESLKATTVWSSGLNNPKYLISSKQLNNFRNGISLETEVDVRAEKCAYFINSEVILQPNSSKKWMLVANVNQGPSDVIELKSFIKEEKDVLGIVQNNVELGTKNLVSIIASADGLQLTNDPLINTRHFANVMFNCMRGGILDDNYSIKKSDFVDYIKRANKEVFQMNQKTLDKLPKTFELAELKKMVLKSDLLDFKRLCTEYLPLGFSRRHGDPSRPWNRFSINTQSEIDGSKILDYEGNWRDIFQNWEALAHSYPEFIDGMLFKFLNASTFEGYNPYRVTKYGFDWEVIEPDDPWSYIGYWGDHQIIYLLKFLEFFAAYFPDKLSSLLAQNTFVYANVPYKIKEYAEMLKNPKDTILFDADLDRKIRQKRENLGADGALLENAKGGIHNVNFIEKILATVLAKCSNFVPEAGIWLSTQRPEWNDANNALVGNGVSVVTLGYLRRFLTFFESVIDKSTAKNFAVSSELLQFFNGVLFTFQENEEKLKNELSDKDRKTILDGVASAGSTYRQTIYTKGFSGEKSLVSIENLQEFTRVSLQFIDHSIAANKRKDSLYHAYNLIEVVNEEEISVSYLNEMLEGQVAVISSGCLSADEVLELLDGLKKSALYRKDQYSYLLYPNKNIARFVDKNSIDAKAFATSKLLQQLVKENNTQIVEKDVDGNYHFNGNFNNANSLIDALEKLPQDKYGKLVSEEKELLLDIFENVFDHKSFTGRSGTFFGYEGLGSIYWHMVSKFVLAVQECCLNAINNNEEKTVVGKLKQHYYEINAGIGVHKPIDLYGAFTTDPYSHTPAGKGAQQPGMTGQVKEDILVRMNELGVSVTAGKLSFGCGLLRKEEFLEKTTAFKYYDIDSNLKEMIIEENSLSFTYCQVPIIYKLGVDEQLTIFGNEENSIKQKSLVLNENVSQQIFSRTGQVQKVVVCLKQDLFC